MPPCLLLGCSCRSRTLSSRRFGLVLHASIAARGLDALVFQAATSGLWILWTLKTPRNGGVQRICWSSPYRITGTSHLCAARHTVIDQRCGRRLQIQTPVCHLRWKPPRRPPEEFADRHRMAPKTKSISPAASSPWTTNPSQPRFKSSRVPVGHRSIQNVNRRLRA